MTRRTFQCIGMAVALLLGTTAPWSFASAQSESGLVSSDMGVDDQPEGGDSGERGDRGYSTEPLVEQEPAPAVQEEATAGAGEELVPIAQEGAVPDAQEEPVPVVSQLMIP